MSVEKFLEEMQEISQLADSDAQKSVSDIRHTFDYPKELMSLSLSSFSQRYVAKVYLDRAVALLTCYRNTLLEIKKEAESDVHEGAENYLWAANDGLDTADAAIAPY